MPSKFEFLSPGIDIREIDLKMKYDWATCEFGDGSPQHADSFFKLT